MTTTNISIQDLVQREVIYCVSSLVHTLTQENKLEEEQAIAKWFEIYHGGDLEDYRQEIFEYYIVTNWLADKLEEQGETVVRDV